MMPKTEQSERGAYLEVGAVHEIDEHEDAHGEEQKGEVVVAPPALGIVEHVDDEPDDGEVEEETQAHFHESVEVAEVFAEDLL